MKRSLWFAFVVMALMLTASQKSWAWGREGHRLTALVAQQYLSPQAAAAVKDLLGAETMADVASWADEYRHDHPETGPWHFVDIPRNKSNYNRNRDCPAPTADAHARWRNCVVDRISYFEARLADTSLPHEERYEALKFLIHFMGDIEQPFHAMGDARGGNDIPVEFLGSAQCGSYNCNLHGVWDFSLIDQQHLGENSFVDYLLGDIREHHWNDRAGGTPEQWANESHRLAVKAWVRAHTKLNARYVAAQTPVVDQQLALGGLRLAQALNTIFGGVPASPFVHTHGPVPLTTPKPVEKHPVQYPQ